MDASDLTIDYQNRLGCHYFQDTKHFREIDLQTWLPPLKKLGASWLVLQAEGERAAIPEPFISGLFEAGIQPILQMSMPLGTAIDMPGFELLFGAYARWGVRHVVLFDSPNSRTAWPCGGWTQQGLVDRFLDRYLPPANLALQSGLTPVFPPLEPGGNFWDTAFLRLSLEALERRKQTGLLDHLMLGAYAWTHGRPLDWGAGGPERWPEAHPYFTPDGAQDQLGFRIGDWYQAIVQTVLQKQVPLILFGAGLTGDPIHSRETAGAPEMVDLYLEIANLCAGITNAEAEPGETSREPLLDQVVACNFWLLSAEEADPCQKQALFDAQGTPRPAGQALLDWAEKNHFTGSKDNADAKVVPAGIRPIHHYLLLPSYPDGISDWDWNVIRGFVKKYQPTVGFQMTEAAIAEQVTLVGSDKAFSEDDLDQLRHAGCQVEWIRGDGMSIATQLAER
ncbi:hypothetical protein LARV_02825 [Longilinea arvoryzae]|uniref:Uncharacterized protein n=1 Tax=Longilinea arvoryzae TaxID=360412 RepID=A0A0S7BML0_9CHLR|nr:hypothetical protein [Longilinea arvoryzae]GAP15045.1 hypothetical protein LARV_02825 [Longilinea arvoryzae]